VLSLQIYPLAVRAKANSAATTVNWTCNFFVSLLFLPLMEILSASVLFLIFFGFVVLSFVFVAMLVPETKGKSMEEIQASVSSIVLSEA
jgi:ABC-type bacteriocin/lantibiotic exporter with double-glycine peptidase domain